MSQSLSEIRYQQQYQQLQNAPKIGVSNVMTYGGRDPVTGGRILTDATGGKSIAQYLSNAEPSGVLALTQTAQLGLTGYATSRVR